MTLFPDPYAELAPFSACRRLRLPRRWSLWLLNRGTGRPKRR
jgi:hypothetical protein